MRLKKEIIQKNYVSSKRFTIKKFLDERLQLLGTGKFNNLNDYLNVNPHSLSDFQSFKGAQLISKLVDLYFLIRYHLF